MMAPKLLRLGARLAPETTNHIFTPVTMKSVSFMITHVILDEALELV